MRHLIASGQPDFSEIEAWLHQAQSEVTRAGEIIRRLRRMVGRGQADTRAVVLITCMHEALALAIPDAAAAGITISLDVPPGIRAMADPIQLQQVLFNLVRNSAEALARTQKKRIEISARACDNEIVVRVADMGEGLNDEVRQRLLCVRVDQRGRSRHWTEYLPHNHRGARWEDLGGRPRGWRWSSLCLRLAVS